jgi:hypothetical protein
MRDKVIGLSRFNDTIEKSTRMSAIAGILKQACLATDHKGFYCLTQVSFDGILSLCFSSQRCSSLLLAWRETV